MAAPDYDSPWKEILDGYFPHFMAFFFPEACADIDWSRGYESLDVELQQLAQDASLGRRFADKLMKVWRRTGTSQMVLVHTEVQGQRERNFPKRLYVYHYRIFDRYDCPVVSLAVLGDANARCARITLPMSCGAVSYACAFLLSNCATTRHAGRNSNGVPIRLLPS